MMSADVLNNLSKSSEMNDSSKYTTPVHKETVSEDVLGQYFRSTGESEMGNRNGQVKDENNTNFTEVPLSNRKREPKRIVHFCDGTLEEYSTEDEDDAGEVDTLNKSALVDPKTLSWVPYMFYLGYWLGVKTLSVCDYLGENLAHFFGITTPKYQYEIEEYQRILQEEEEVQRREDEEKASGWMAAGVGSTTASTEQLTNISVEPSPFNISFKKVPAGSTDLDENDGTNCSSLYSMQPENMKLLIGSGCTEITPEQRIDSLH